MRTLSTALLLALFGGLACGGPEIEPGPTVDSSGELDVPVDTDYLVVSTTELERSARDFVDFRRGTGFRAAHATVKQLAGEGADYAALSAEVRALLQRSRDHLGAEVPLYLLLLGDVSAGLPAELCANLLGGCDTDNGYADLDDDNLPDVAVGRLPVHTEAEASQYLNRLKRHESSYEPGPWNRRLVLYTGEGGFGDIIDTALEGAVMEGLTRLDPAFDVVGAYNNPDSPYYYTPFDDKVVELINDGSLAVVYIGHGSSNTQSGLSSSQMDAVTCQHRYPVAFFFACLNGDYRGQDDSIAEALVKLADGPVATVAASDLSHPYGNAVLSYEVERALFDKRPATVGQVLIEAKLQSMVNADDFRGRIDTISLLSGVMPGEQQTLRHQHLDLYNLFGDPAAIMQYPRNRAHIDPVRGNVQRGPLYISGVAAGIEFGSAMVTLETERDEIHGQLIETDPADLNYQAHVQSNWTRAVNKVITGDIVAVQGGYFEVQLDPGPGLDPARTYVVKVYASDEVSDSFGAIKLLP